mgnify:CR=1 FL=1
MLANKFLSRVTPCDLSKHALSNKSRFGIQQAMFEVFLENPISGTGYGLQAFESWKKYPNWAKNNNWEFRLKYLNQNDKKFPPGYNLYLRILFFRFPDKHILILLENKK